MIKNEGDLRAQIHKFKLNRLEEQIVALAKPSVAIQRTAANDETLPIGASKLGGSPDLPPGFEWKYFGDKPLTFIAQFTLSEIAPYDVENILPPRGRLYFFYDADEQPWGAYDERDGWQVVYAEDEAAPLVRIPHPRYPLKWGFIDALPAHAVRFESGMTLPEIFGGSSMEYDILFDESSDEFENYWKMYEAAYPAPRHHLLGYPWLIQSAIEGQSVIGRYQMQPQKMVGPKHYVYTDEQLAFIYSEMPKWQFLFQIDTDDDLKVMWGDVGTLYIAIPKASLAARRFEDCWTVLQCS